MFPVIVVNGSEIHVAWDGVQYKKSVDGGVTWENTTTIASGDSPEIAVGPGGIHIIFVAHDGEDPYETFYTKSVDGGVNWTTPKRLTYGHSHSTGGRILEDKDGIHVIWLDEVTAFLGDLYYRKSVDGGNTWTEPVLLVNASKVNGINTVDIMSNKDGLHIVWEAGFLVGAYNLYYLRSTDGGLRWSNDTKIATGGSTPVIVADDDNMYVAYTGGVLKSTDGGGTWGVILSKGFSDPQMTVNSEGVHIVWHSGSVDGNFEIYYKQGVDGGLTWGNDTRLTYAPALSLYPRIATNSNGVYVVWYDYRNGDADIYFKRTMNTTESINATLQQGWNLLSLPFDI